MTKNMVKLFSDTLFVFYGQNFILTFNHIARYALAVKIKFMLHKNSKIVIA